MDKILISVVVPIYNVEKYIDNCLRSIIRQSYKNIEIILVDDGSTDQSGIICEKYAKLDNRIKVIHKKNEGLGLARNSGLELVSGQYVAFIDSDDFIAEDMIDKLVDSILKNNVDTVYCGYYEYYNHNLVLSKPCYYSNNIFEGEEITSKILLEMIGTSPKEKNDSLVSMSVWHALYSTEIIKQNLIKFPSEREYISEDIVFDILYLKCAKRIMFIEDCLYFYRCNNINSLTHKYKKDEFLMHKKVVDKLNFELSKIMKKEQYINRTDRYLLGRLRTCIKKIINYGKKDEKFKIKSEIMKLVSLPYVVECMKRYPYRKNPIQHRIFNYAIKYKKIYLIIILIKIKSCKKTKRF